MVRRMSHRYYAKATWPCICGGISTRILKKNQMRVCARCGIGRIGENTFIAKEDVPGVLAGTHILNEDGEVIPVEEEEQA